MLRLTRVPQDASAMAAGGGLDIPFGRHLAIRALQAEYVLTRFDRSDGSSATQNNLRVSTGIVFRFGGR